MLLSCGDGCVGGLVEDVHVGVHDLGQGWVGVATAALGRWVQLAVVDRDEQGDEVLPVDRRMAVLDEVLSANEQYAASFGAKSELALPPARRFAILTCMDARLDPAKYAGLSEGDAHVIRNAGGRASDDAIRSLVISYKLLGTREWFVIHHTECGMEFFTDEVMRGLLEQSLETAELGQEGCRDVGSGPGSSEAKYIDWLTISDRDTSVVEDVTRIRSHPLVPSDIPIYGYVYDVKNGNLIEVRDATAAGRAS